MHCTYPPPDVQCGSLNLSGPKAHLLLSNDVKASSIIWQKYYSCCNQGYIQPAHALQLLVAQGFLQHSTVHIKNHFQHGIFGTVSQLWQMGPVLGPVLASGQQHKAPCVLACRVGIITNCSFHQTVTLKSLWSGNGTTNHAFVSVEPAETKSFASHQTWSPVVSICLNLDSAFSTVAQNGHFIPCRRH